MFSPAISVMKVLQFPFYRKICEEIPRTLEMCKIKHYTRDFQNTIQCIYKIKFSLFSKNPNMHGGISILISFSSSVLILFLSVFEKCKLFMKSQTQSKGEKKQVNSGNLLPYLQKFQTPISQEILTLRIIIRFSHHHCYINVWVSININI